MSEQWFCEHCGGEIRSSDLVHAITNIKTGQSRYFHGEGVCNYVANDCRLYDPDAPLPKLDIAIVWPEAEPT